MCIIRYKIVRVSFARISAKAQRISPPQFPTKSLSCTNTTKLYIQLSKKKEHMQQHNYRTEEMEIHTSLLEFGQTSKANKKLRKSFPSPPFSSRLFVFSIPSYILAVNFVLLIKIHSITWKVREKVFEQRPEKI